MARDLKRKRGDKTSTPEVSFEWLSNIQTNKYSDVSETYLKNVMYSCQQTFFCRDKPYNQSEHPAIHVYMRDDEGTFRDRLFVTRSSLPNAGQGLFASTDIHRDEAVTVYLGEKSNQDTHYSFQSTSGELINASSRRHYFFAHYINHSSDPNCIMDTRGIVRSLKEIRKNTELTIDYGGNTLVGERDVLFTQVQLLRNQLLQLRNANKSNNG